MKEFGWSAVSGCKIILEISLRYRKKLFFGISGLFFLAHPLAGNVRAEPLTQDECTVLRQQKKDLDTKGLVGTLSKGAKWASENLNAEQIGEVGSYLTLLEQLRFRCRVAKRGSKSKSALQKKVPLPVRNPQRLKKKKADIKGVVSSTEMSSKMAPETKSVISAVTGGGSNQSDDRPPMRKTFGE